MGAIAAPRLWIQPDPVYIPPMIEHLQSHLLGLVHTTTALVALILGLIMILRRKGGRSHRWIGRCYLVAMLALNITALMIYDLYGRFGPFHWMALFSLLTVLGGYRAARRKVGNWRHPHAYYMTGSFVGLVAATVAEIASRVPGWSFGASVVISSTLVIVIGVVIMFKRVPATVGGNK